MNKVMMSFRPITAFFLASCAFSFANASSTLTINSMHSDPTAKKAFDTVLTNFKNENKDINVVLNTIDHESYKVQMRTWLPNTPPDIATWFAGNRASYFVEKGLIEPLDDVWAKVGKDFSAAAAKSVTFNGKVFLMPTNYYHWGFYYRKDVFQSAGIKTPPKTWTELVTASVKLKSKGITPITIGTKQSWPAAAWFDLINMGVNGFDSHMALLSGKTKYTDPAVVKTMETWQTLVDAKAFPENAPALTWQEASSLLWQGKAGMYLMGNFINTEIPASVKDKMGFFPFPNITPSQKQSQVAPTDVYFIPAKAKNKNDAKKFMLFLARADTQQIYNEITGQIPANTKATIDANNPYLVSGRKLLQEAAHLSQFYDRDANPEVAKVGMDGFVEFMAFPSRTKEILARIDSVRARVHNP